MSGGGGGLPGGAAGSIQRRMDLRKQQKTALETKIEQVRQENDQTVVKMAQGLFMLTQKVGALEEANSRTAAAVTGLMAMAQSALWRSMAIQKVLPALGINEELVVQKANELLVADFEAASDKNDAELGLVKADSQEEAKAGYTAVASLRTFKDGKEAVAFRAIRTRFEVGGTDTFPQVTEAVLGMKVGDVKRFALNVQNQVDECELTLVGLRRPGDYKEETHGVQTQGSEGDSTKT